MSLALLAIAVAIAGKQVPPAELMSKLTRGVNVSRWFCYCDPHDTAHFTNYLTDEDFRNFHRLGVHFVRLCVEPEAIYGDGTPDPANLPYLDAAIDRLEKEGFAVVLDLHDTHDKMKLDQQGHDNSGFLKFWTAMAQHEKGRGETSTVFELVNEPIFRNNPEDWYKLQVQAVDAVRGADPERTILVASTGYNSVDTLVKMTPLPAGNLIYSFHCYDPFIFTHQGATWSSEQVKVMRNLPFPSSPEGVSAVLNAIPAEHRAAAVAYGNHRYDAAYLRSRLAKAADWGAQNHVPVFLGEFGCYPPAVQPDSRGRWFDAMRDAIQELNLPSSLWAYDDALGLGRKQSPDGKIVLDPVTLDHYFKEAN